jgi:hypothetical protein
MIIKEVLVLKDAETDLEKGKEFYDKRESGVGDYFWDSLLSDIESLVIFAGIHKKEFNFHCMFTKRFPYAIYYYINSDVAYVVAVLPIRRNPVWIKDNLSQRS